MQGASSLETARRTAPNSISHQTQTRQSNTKKTIPLSSPPPSRNQPVVAPPLPPTHQRKSTPPAEKHQAHPRSNPGSPKRTVRHHHLSFSLLSNLVIALSQTHRLSHHRSSLLPPASSRRLFCNGPRVDHEAQERLRDTQPSQKVDKEKRKWSSLVAPAKGCLLERLLR